MIFVAIILIYLIFGQVILLSRRAFDLDASAQLYLSFLWAWHIFASRKAKVEWLIQHDTSVPTFDTRDGRWPTAIYHLYPDPSDWPPYDFKGKFVPDMRFGRKDGKRPTPHEYRLARRRARRR